MRLLVRCRKIFLILVLVLSALFFSSAMAQEPTFTQWAKSVTTGSKASDFWAVTVDSGGNVYASGYIEGSSSYGFGNGVTVTGTSSINAVLVKYDGGGNAQWAKSVTAGSSGSAFTSIAVDSGGNVYASGYIEGSSSYAFGNGVTVTGTSSSVNAVLVKYDSSGNAQWAKSVTAGSSDSGFTSIAVDASGNIYAAGFISGTGIYSFGNDVTIFGVSSGDNIVLVKYDSSGNAQWAKSVTSGSGKSDYYSITVDSNANVYAAGLIYGNGSYNFGNGVVVAGTYSYQNIVLIKYDSNGNAQWAKSVTAGSDASELYSIKVDSNGSIYVAGFISGTEKKYGFGNNVTVSGAAEKNLVFIKYDSSGNAQWADSVVSGTSYSNYISLALDLTGNVYAVGFINGAGTYNFGNNVAVSGAYSLGRNILLVKYDSNGYAQLAKSVTSGPNTSDYSSITVDSNANIYAVGRIYGNGSYNFGNGVVVAGTCSSDYNIVLAQYYKEQILSSSSSTGVSSSSTGEGLSSSSSGLSSSSTGQSSSSSSTGIISSSTGHLLSSSSSGISSSSTGEGLSSSSSGLSSSSTGQSSSSSSTGNGQASEDSTESSSWIPWVAGIGGGVIASGVGGFYLYKYIKRMPPTTISDETNGIPFVSIN